MKTWLAALGLLGLMMAEAVRAGHVEQRMIVGAEVIAPCTIENTSVHCASGQHPQTRTIEKPSTPVEASSDMNKPSKKDSNLEAFSHHFEVIF